MKVTCEFLCHPRNSARKGKCGKAVVNVVSNNNKENATASLVVSMLKNKSHIQHKLTSNISKIFDRFIDEGKLNIQLIQPEVDLLISKAPPQQLAMFAKIVQAVKDNRMGIVDRLSNKPVTSAFIRKELNNVTKMKISARENYPFGSSLPNSLQEFRAPNCKLMRFDVRLSKLPNLVVLDLESNRIKSSTLSLISMRNMSKLASLNLSHNNLGMIPSNFWANLPKSLSALYLSHNNLTSLPFCISSLLPSLKLLDVSHNNLTSLPPTLGHCGALSTLKAGSNQLEFLPTSMRFLRMQEIDLSDNTPELCCKRSLDDASIVPMSLNNIPPLLELAGRVCIQKRLPTKVVPRNLHEYVSRFFVQCCICKTGVCLPSQPHIQKDYGFDIRRISNNVASLGLPGTPLSFAVNFRGPACSNICSLTSVL